MATESKEAVVASEESKEATIAELEIVSPIINWIQDESRKFRCAQIVTVDGDEIVLKVSEDGFKGMEFDDFKPFEPEVL